jgi:hypothetical protein
MTGLVIVMSQKAGYRTTESYRTYGYDSQGLIREVGDYFKVFVEIATYCYTIGRSEIVRNALHEEMRDSAWTVKSTSNVLILLAAKYINQDLNDSWESGADVLSQW